VAFRVNAKDHPDVIGHDRKIDPRIIAAERPSVEEDGIESRGEGNAADTPSDLDRKGGDGILKGTLASIARPRLHPFFGKEVVDARAAVAKVGPKDRGRSHEP
jgi:hypothetical protein